MKDTDFARTTGYLRVLEKRILSGDAINRIIDIGSPEEALRMLAQNSEYDFGHLKKPEDYDAVLKESLEAAYKWLYANAEDAPIPELLAAKYDYHNLKAALKSKFLKIPHKHLYIRASATDPELLDAFVASGAHHEIIKPHLRSAAKEAEDAFNASHDPQMIDILLDARMFAFMVDICGQLDNEFITEYVRALVEFHNIKTLLRVKNMRKDMRFLRDALVEGGITDLHSVAEQYESQPDAIIANIIGKNPKFHYFSEACTKAAADSSAAKNYSALEKLFDNYLLDYLKKTKYIAYGPEILFSYILYKENEIRQIRILMTCKINNIREQTLRERLRDNYV